MRKKIMIIICTIVILCAGSMVSAATTFKDIKGKTCEDSVDTLITLGLVSGYPEDNTYRPENAVTRAEMAKLMVVALGQDGNLTEASKKTTKFKDMQGHWAYGYVNIASELGIINGYPNGTFGPNNTVSYAEATAMIIRALEFEDVVSKSTEAWPNNYINQAKELSLYSNVGTINSSDGAKRGNVAIMLWNMLRTGVCTVTGQNSSGLIYGEGEKLINKKMTKFTYFDEVLIDDIDFDDDFETADVKLKGDKTVTITMDASEASKMFGQKYDILYNNSTKKIIKSEKTSKNTTKQGFIEEVTSSKIYIDGGSTKGYELPKSSNILLYGVDDLDEAVEAILVFSGSTLEYVVAFPPEQVYLGMVTESDVSISKKNDGIKVANYKVSSTKTYPMADEDDMPDEDDIILYYLNADNEVVILKSANINDSEIITDVTKSKIEMDDDTTISLKDSDTYQIAKVYKSTLKAMSYSDIEEDEDSAIVFNFGGIDYVVVFVGGAEDASTSSATLKSYQSKLTSLISDAKSVSETKYTQSTYANLMTALTNAETVKSTSSKWKDVTKVKSAYNTLNSAYDKLTKATTTSEKDTVKAKSALRTYVNSSTVTNVVKNKSTYTSTSYATFNNALSTANTQLSKTNATETNLKNAKTNLETAISKLVKNTDANDKDTAIKALDSALTDASNVKAKENYTETSYALFKSMWDVAKTVKDNSSSKTIADINQATTNLKNAIDGLDTIAETEYDKLLRVLKNASEITNENYFDDEFKKFEEDYKAANALNESSSNIKEKREALETAIENLNKNKISDALSKAIKEAEPYERATEVKNALEKKESSRAEKIEKIDAINKAVKAEKDAVTLEKSSLSSYINLAENEAKKTSLYIATDITTLKNEIVSAKEILEKDKVTSEELAEASNKLDNATDVLKSKKITTSSTDTEN